LAKYKHANFLAKSEDAEFDKVHQPGIAAPFSGVYRCPGCHREIASNEGEPLPPQTHHAHNQQTQGAIRWRLIVYADHQPK